MSSGPLMGAPKMDSISSSNNLPINFSSSSIRKQTRFAFRREDVVVCFGDASVLRHGSAYWRYVQQHYQPCRETRRLIKHTSGGEMRTC